MKSAAAQLKVETKKIDLNDLEVRALYYSLLHGIP
jgi:hypothetical protein